MNRKQRRAAQKRGAPVAVQRPPANVRIGHLLSEGMAHVRGGRLAEASTALRAALAMDARQPAVLHRLGLVEHLQGRTRSAAELIEQSLLIDPSQPDALSDLSAILREMGQPNRALTVAERAVAIAPRHARAHSNLGNALGDLRRLADAANAHMAAVELDPRSAVSHVNLAAVLLPQNRNGETLAACDRAIALAPGLAEAHGIRAQALQRLDRHVEALAAFERAIALKPTLARLHTEAGNSLRNLGRFEEALAAHQRTLAALPQHAEAHGHLAVTHQSLGHWQEALASYRTAIRLAPDYCEAHSNLGVLLQQLGRLGEAIESYRAAIALNPGYGLAHYNLGNTLQDANRLEEAIQAYRQAIACEPGLVQARFQLCSQRRHACDWRGLAAEDAECLQELADQDVRVPPFTTLTISPDPALQLAHAQRWAHGFAVAAGAILRPQRIDARDRPIRLGYLSCDFHRHATARLIVELLERHDRQHFSVTGYCFSPDDGSDIRRRVLDAFDRHIPIHGMSHAAAAQQIHADGIDVLIDLKGYTKDARTEIVAHRPAPIQVNFLGYPGSMGAGFIDYIIADQFVAPMHSQPHFTERIVHLPDCYQPNDGQRRIAEGGPSRTECGLPEGAFVFAAFNNAYKITPDVFARWMRLLGGIPGSVLWLLDSNPLAKGNLCREAVAAGIDPARLVFARRMRLEEHLARHRHADLFLDTLPVNAHTTASDALWAGLPVVTCAGEAFVSRVAGSLLNCLGLSELVTRNLDDYEALALRLASDPPKLAEVRARLLASRQSAPLFDAARYARNLEAAFMHMVQLNARGEPPRAFAVSDVIPDAKA